MKIAEGPDVYGYTIFCDDIRVEVGGKVTYVGAYHQIMFVPQFPIVLPKFAMQFFYMQRRPNVVTTTKIIIVTPGFTEDNPGISFALPEEEARRLTAEAEATVKADDDETRYLMIGGPVTLTNLVLSAPGYIAVRAVRGDEYIRLGRLKISQNPAIAPTAMKEAAN